MTAPSNANTSGLEVVAWRWRYSEPTPDEWYLGHEPPRQLTHGPLLVPIEDIEPLVTAASAQAAIDAEREQFGRMLVEAANARDAAEAQVDKLARALETLEAERKRDGVNLAHLKRAVAVAYADFNRAALQQETQP